MYDKFQKDLKAGNKGEQIVADFLESNGKEILGFSNYKFYDIKVQHGKYFFTVEVKYDFYRKGNIVFEFESRGKPSGIAATKSDYFAIVFKDEEDRIWWIRTDELRSLLFSKHFFYTTGGDDGTSKMLIMSKDDIGMYFDVFNPNQQVDLEQYLQ